MFTHDAPPPIIKKRMSFFSVGLLCLTAIIVTVTFCVSGVAMYGLHIVDKKADTLPALVATVAEKLPALYDALPPALVDAVDDERAPDYLSQLKIKVRLGDEDDNWGGRRAIVEVENTGDSTVSMLTLRIVNMDKNGEPVGEERTWAASPLQMDGSWRGPILPHATRKFVVRCHHAADVASVSHEVTDIRLWKGPQEVDDDAESASARKVAQRVR